MQDRSKTDQDFSKILNALLGKTLDLGEASIHPSQFKAFRKIIMDMFGEARRNLNKEKGWCGESKSIAEKVVNHD